MNTQHPIRVVMSALFLVGVASLHGESFTGSVNVLTNQNYTVGTNGLTLNSNANGRPNLNFVRSVGTWADTWWGWTMGTDNKLRLDFSTVPQITLQNGAMGLGTDSPLNRLHVADGDIRISRTSGTWGPNLVLDGTKVGTGGVSWSVTSSTASDIGGAGRLAFVVNNSPKTVIEPSGNVGIGTTNPGAKVHVSNTGGSGSAYGLRITGDNGGSNGARSALLLEDVDAGGKSYSLSSRYGKFFIHQEYSPWAPLLTGDTSGNVGIGTTNPTNKLEVNGTIRAKEVIVETTGWSDYVFAPDYRLAPLSEVEAHIAAKGTLPGIPSAAEVATQGVSVGDMQAKLLAKVEELTLHMISQEKRIAQLEAENAALRAK